MSSVLPSAQDVWTFFVAPKLPAPLSYAPLVFRVLSILLAAPFAFGVALDLIAYAIARTLNISASSLRVPRSPPRVPRDLQPEVEVAEDDWEVPSAFTAGLESRQMSPKKTDAELPAAPAPTPFNRPLQLLALGALILAVSLQWFSAMNTTNALHRLAALSADFQGAVTATASPTALVLTAHPDDEVMFFAPTILSLVSAGWGVLAICLSNGNADGLGAVRTQELYESYARLGVASENVTLVDDLELQDSMSAKWDARRIAHIIGPHIAHHDVTYLITFDSIGVSQHPNHISLSEVYPHLPSPRPKFVELQSPSLATKFTGPVWALFVSVRDTVSRLESPRTATPNVSGASPALGRTSPRNKLPIILVSSPGQYVTAIRAMLAHSSQLVWFRWLYVSFSHLMWVNELIDASL